MIYEMGKNLTSPKLPHHFFPGKNWIRKIREKSGYEILAIFDQILLFEHINGMLYKSEPK